MATRNRILILNEVLPGKLRQALERDAKRQNLTMNDLACSILCGLYGIECETSGQPFRETAAHFRLRVPEQLRRELGIEAAEDGATIRGIALNLLASHYKLASIPTNRRPRSAA